MAAPHDTLPLVSILMPARNHAAYVATALRSILAQSHARIELIVIDDGSTDGTPDEIARALASASRDIRVEFHRQENAGLGATLLRALGMAQGEYVQFLASDDALFPGMTERLVAAFADAGADVAAVACDGYVFDEAAGGHAPFSQLHPQPLGANQHREMMAGNWLPAMGLLYRRDLLLEEGGFDPHLTYEDWGLLLNLTRRFRVLQIPDRLFLYRRHGHNTSADQARMARGHGELQARHPELARVHRWKNAILSLRPMGILRGLTLGNLDLALRVLVRRAQRVMSARPGNPVSRAFGRHPAMPGLDLNETAQMSRGVEIRQLGRGQIIVGPDCVVEDGAVLIAGTGDLMLGAGCHIAAGAELIAGEGLVLGQGCFVGPGARVGGPGAPTQIGRGCLLAEGCAIGGGTILGDLSAVGPGQTLVGAIPSGAWILHGAGGWIGETTPAFAVS